MGCCDAMIVDPLMMMMMKALSELSVERVIFVNKFYCLIASISYRYPSLPLLSYLPYPYFPIH